MAGIELRPIFGGFDPRAMRMAIKGMPVYPSSLTLHTVEHVHAMMAVMGDNDICVLRGHGVVVCGSSVEDATIKAIKLDNLATINLQAALPRQCRLDFHGGSEGVSDAKITGMGGGGAETLVAILLSMAEKRIGGAKIRSKSFQRVATGSVARSGGRQSKIQNRKSKI